MENTITVSATQKEMTAAFDKLNIRYYELVDKTQIPSDEIKMNWNVTIRHNENDNPVSLFEEAIKSLQPPVPGSTVYAVNWDKAPSELSIIGYSLDDFISEAKRQGLVYTGEEFAKIFNDETITPHLHTIRIVGAPATGTNNILSGSMECMQFFPVPPFITSMDWELLRLQKDALLSALDKQDTGSLVSSELEGIVHLIDAVQDYAVDKCGIPEVTVFPNLPQAGYIVMLELIGGSVQPVFREDETLMFFATKEEAQAEIDDAIQSWAQSTDEGHAEGEYTQEDYSIKEAVRTGSHIQFEEEGIVYGMLETDDDAQPIHDLLAK